MIPLCHQRCCCSCVSSILLVLLDFVLVVRNNPYQDIPRKERGAGRHYAAELIWVAVRIIYKSLDTLQWKFVVGTADGAAIRQADHPILVVPAALGLTYPIYSWLRSGFLGSKLRFASQLFCGGTCLTSRSGQPAFPSEQVEMGGRASPFLLFDLTLANGKYCLPLFFESDRPPFLVLCHACARPTAITRFASAGRFSQPDSPG